VRPIVAIPQCLECRPPEAVIEASDKQAEVAPHIQDDFNDIDEDELKEAANRGMAAFHVRFTMGLQLGGVTMKYSSGLGLPDSEGRGGGTRLDPMYEG